jgi:hypothetical protein
MPQSKLHILPHEVGLLVIRLNRKSASELMPKDAANDEVTDTYYIY